VTPSKLLYLASSFPYGRNDTFLGPEARELVRQGVQVTVVPVRPRGPLTTADAAMLTVRKPLLDLDIAWSALAEAVRSPAAVAAALTLLFRRPAPKVLLRNLAAFPKALWLARVARRWPADHIHAHWAGPPSTVALIASRLSGVPWSFTAHVADIEANNLLREKIESATFVRFIGRSMMDIARRLAPGSDESTWRLLHLGIDLPPARDTPPHLNRPHVLLATAHFVSFKDHVTLVEATAELIREGFELEVWLAGSGPLRAEVERRVRERGLDHVVRFHGFVPNSQVLEWLARGQVDVVVLPSFMEGIPFSLVEALAHGVPAVASDVGAVAELVGDGCGELVPTRDPRALADAVARLLRSPQLRSERARAGRSRIEREFAIEVVVRSLRDLLGFTAADTREAEHLSDSDR
jgi:colanic acid/amylovoran biosynthesis glycosyltransferase